MTGTSVRAVNVLTGESRTISTNELGEYSIPGLPVGSYRVEADNPGFKRSVRTGIELTVNQNARVDLTLEVGALEQSVEVTSAPTQVNTATAEIGTLVDTKRVEELPLNGRNVYDLVTLMPGVARTTTRVVQSRDNNVVSVNGGRPTSNNFLLDGGMNNDIWRNQGNTAPNPDAVQEFRVLSANTSAEFGRLPGATINVITKSGTNELHGSAFEFLRNNVLNARNFFQSTVSPLHYNQYGGSLGGPLIKNRTFLFGSFQQLRQTTETFSNSALPPTAAERAGDFSAAPMSQRPVNAQKVPYPNGQIPFSELDPVALNIVNQSIPLPNTPDGRYQYTQPETANQWEFLLKGDHQFNEKEKLSISYFQLKTDLRENFANGNNIPNFASRLNGVRQRNLVVNHTSLLTNNLFNEVRFNWMRRSTPWLWDYPKTLNDYGSQVVIGAEPATPPRINVSGRLTMGTYWAVGLDQSLNWADSVTWVKDRHNIKFGGGFMWGFYNENGTSAGSGNLAFTGANTNNATADFLTGRGSFTEDNGNFPDFRGKSFYTFVQDDWKILPRLTLNLGLRYELSAPLVWTTDWMTNFSPNQQSTVFPTAPAGLIYKGDSGFQRGGRKFDKNNVAPRIGISLDPFGNGKTAIRAAYGVFFLSQYGDGIRASQPYITSITVPATTNLVNPWSNFPGGNPFPANLSNPRFVTPIQVIHFDEDAATPYVQQLNFTIEQQLAKKFTLQASYIGTLGRKGQMNWDQNAPIYIPGQSTFTNYNNRRPYMPGTFSNIATYSTAANSSYNAFQIVANRRFDKGLTVLADYTFAKSLDTISSDALNANVPFTDNRNFNLDRAPSDGQPQHIGKLSVLYELPRVKRWSWVGSQILSGWQANGIWSIQSGLPFSVTSGQDSNTDGNVNDRANLIGNPRLSTDRPRGELIQQYFNTAAFGIPVLGNNGTSGRNILWGPGMSNTDLSFFKIFRIRERDQLQFRAELFNAFNQVRLGNPTTAMNSGNYGKILTAMPPRIVQFGLRYAF
jgi:carboxypeptidase family protein